MRNAVGYGRQSVRAEGGESLEVQRERVEDHAERQGFNLVAWYEDAATSGGTEHRDGWDRLLTHCGRGGVERVYLYDRSRFARDVRLSRNWEHALEQLGISVESYMEPSTGDPVMDRFRNTLVDANAEHYRLQTGRKVSEAKRRKFETGWPAGNLPLGYHYIYAMDGSRRRVKDIEVDPDRASVIKGAFARYATGHYSRLQIARWAEGQGMTMRSGSPMSRDSWRKILQRPCYMGWQERNGKRVRTTYEPLVSEELWYACQEAAAARRHSQTPTRQRHPYPLRGLVECDEGVPLFGITSGRGHRYYAHPRNRGGRTKTPCDQGYVRAAGVEGVIRGYFQDIDLDADTVALAHELIDAAPQAEAGRGARLARQRDRLSHQHEIGLIDDAELAQRLAQLRAEEAQVPVQRHDPNVQGLAHGLADLARQAKRASPAALEELFQIVLRRVIVAAPNTVKAIEPLPDFLPLLGVDWARRFGGMSLVPPGEFESPLPA